MRKKNKKRELKKEAERLMYQLAFRLYGDRCEICGSKKGVVVHHFVFRSKCKALTYEKDNLIVLCRDCHFKLHHTKSSSIIELKIIQKRGEKWLKRLLRKYEKAKKLPSYYGVRWLEEQIKKLKREIKK